MIYEKYSNYSKYFTDGLKSDFGVGAAAFLEEENILELNAKHSIVVAELYAIYRCLLHFAEYSTSSLVVILTDSLSSILILNIEFSKRSWSMITEIKRLLVKVYLDGRKIVIQWIPAHVRIIGNELVDILATEATGLEEIT